MPKEITYAAPAGTEPPCRVHVGWTRAEAGGYVEVATLPSEAAELQYAPTDGEPAPAHTGWQFVDLDRQGINKLIRDLRRARDQAFGRDE